MGSAWVKLSGSMSPWLNISFAKVTIALYWGIVPANTKAPELASQYAPLLGDWKPQPAAVPYACDRMLRKLPPGVGWLNRSDSGKWPGWACFIASIIDCTPAH